MEKQYGNIVTSGLDDLDSLVQVDDLTTNPLVELPAEGDPRLYLTSYSSSLLQHSCLRKYQLTKLSKNSRPVDSMQELTFQFGHTVGDAVVRLMQGVPLERVLWETVFLGWPSQDFFQENPKQKKSMFHAIYALEKLNSMLQDGFMDDYELVYLLDGRPAAEVSYKLYLPGGYIERGYIDMILRSKITGKFCIFDNKTSSARYLNAGQYQNSAQALGYSVVLDKLAPGMDIDYTVSYFVWLTFLERWEHFEFPKTEMQRAQWIQSKLWDVEELKRVRETYGDYGMWPLSGEACFSYNRPCPFMDTCQLQTEKLILPLRQSDINNRDPELNNIGKPWDVVVDWSELKV